MALSFQKLKPVIIGLAIALVCIVVGETIRAVIARDKTVLVSFSPDTGRFRILLPQTIITTNDEIDTKIGLLKQTTFKARSKYVQFVVGYTDYPTEYINQTRPAEILAAAAASVASNMNGKLKREESFLSKGLATRQVWVKGRKGVHVRSRLMLVGNRMYQVTAFAQRRHIFDRLIERVFESFEVLPDTTSDNQNAVSPVTSSEVTNP